MLSVGPPPPDLSPRSRLEWARQHSYALKLRYSAYLRESEPHKVVRERDPKTGDHVWRLHIEPPLPTFVSLMVGDWANSVRAAMDNLIWLYRNKTVAADSVLRHIAFQVSANEHDWTSWRGRVATALPADLLDKLYQLQPHKSGIEALAVLDLLWNRDKHRAPHVALAMTVTGEFRVSVPDDAASPYGTEGVIWGRGPFHEGDEVVRFPYKPGPEPDLDALFTFAPAFDESGPGRGQPLFVLLDSLQNYVATQVFPEIEAIPKP